MILIDTSIWVDHFKLRDGTVEKLLLSRQVVMHPWIIGEIAMGTYRNRLRLLSGLSELTRAAVASEAELVGFVERHKLYGIGIGFIDAGLLASAMLSADTALWTKDRRLHSAADRLGVAAEISGSA